MKKKKTAAIVAPVILCAAVVFSAAVLTGCGASGYFAEPEDAVYPTRAERIAELDGCAVGTGSNGTYVVTKQSGSSVQYGLYDFVGRRFVSPLGEGVITLTGGAFLRTAAKSGETEYTVYTSKGQIGVYKDVPDITRVSRDDVRVDVGGVTYFADMSTGAYETVEGLGLYIDSRADYETDKYLIVDGTETGEYEYYDADTFGYIRTVYAFRGLPADVLDGFVGVLSDGDILVQALVSVPEGSKGADLYYEGAGFDLITQIVSAGSGSRKDKNVDFCVTGYLDNSALNSSFADKYDCDNIAAVMKIHDDTRVLTEQTYVVLSDSLGIKYELSELTSGTVTPRNVNYLGDNRFIFNGDLYDGGGKLLASDVLAIGNEYIRKTFADGTVRIYDAGKLEEVYSYEPDDGYTRQLYGYGDKLVVCAVGTDGEENVSIMSGGDVYSFKAEDFSGGLLASYGMFVTSDGNGGLTLYALGKDLGITELMSADDLDTVGSFENAKGGSGGLIIAAVTDAESAIYVVTAD